ncbi:TetR/AcrR family transcriptional regulator C-terminal domain-containing protein [Rhizobium sp. L1K21]|uniref:TetR/AcrR family transcriptional regulator C-terminal domain-containing protein n=1 Tax=Rhizobium sp. L1K21 TaxID=2954933 RepID=UPI0020923036|nr:TetR/AcrR family transcriptional regulator C-terminal domain-containing protein [Rhizobium sp. L1K21]MCO6188264.1 TetR/AcrR family transcriptional regulator C-terminal domain-containing protein [Rhizobium sp. L1K21]
MADKTAGNRQKGQLSKSRVVEAAIRLADKDGIAALTMRKLAQSLGVEAMSLYHHLPNKDAMLGAMVDQIFAEISPPPEGKPWKDAISARAGSAREVLMRHPWAVQVLETRRNPGTITLSHHDAVIGCFRRAGFTVALAAHAYSLIDSYIYGFVMQETTLPFKTGEEAHAVAEQILQGLPEEQYPHLAEMTRELVLKPGYAYSNEFEFGLELILDGLEAALT